MEAELRAYRADHPAIAGLFFTYPQALGLNPDDMSSRFARRMGEYLVDHDGQRIGLHGLRHSYITNLIVGKVDLNTVSKLAGHHSASYTVDVYGHLLPDVARAAVDRLDAALDGGQA